MTEICMGRAGWHVVFTAAWLVAATAVGAQQQDLPAGMSFVAQDESLAWRLYRVDAKGAPHTVPTQVEPRQACVSLRGGTAVYAGADGAVRVVSLTGAAERVLATSNAKRTFTQPCISADGSEVYAVEMIEGKSLETEVVRFSASGEASRVAYQPGAQQEPFIHGGRWLVYTSIGCSDGCGQFLIEVWSRDLLAARTRQLTLLNAVAQGPVTDGRRALFSSDASGTFQLWQVGLDGTGLRKLTAVDGQAVQPALCDGSIYFVNGKPGGSSLAKLADDGAVTTIALPGLKSFRALRCVS